jgi:hypothetical protein
MLRGDRDTQRFGKLRQDRSFFAALSVPAQVFFPTSSSFNTLVVVFATQGKNSIRHPRGCEFTTKESDSTKEPKVLQSTLSSPAELVASQGWPIPSPAREPKRPEPRVLQVNRIGDTNDSPDIIDA